MTPTRRKRIKDAIERVDLGSVRITPVGADKPLEPFTEADVTITPEDVDRAIRKWDEMMPDWAGLLEAKVEPPTNTENTDTAA